MDDELRAQIERAIYKAMSMDMNHYNGKLDFQDGFVSGVSWTRSLIEKETDEQLNLLKHVPREAD